MTPLIDETRIERTVRELGRRIADDYRERPLTIIGVLTGSIVFLSDLIRRIDAPSRVGLIQASSYRGKATSPGPLNVNDELMPDIHGRDVLLVDDIFDTGLTLERLIGTIRTLQPASVRSAVLLWKEGRSRVTIVPDYHGFKIPDAFVVGYGLDYNDEHRHLPYIASLEEADLA